MHVLAHLVAEAGGDFDQFDAAPGAIGLQLRQRPGQIVMRRHVQRIEQGGELRQRQRLRRGEQGGLE